MPAVLFARYMPIVWEFNVCRLVSPQFCSNACPCVTTYGRCKKELKPLRTCKQCPFKSKNFLHCQAAGCNDKVIPEQSHPVEYLVSRVYWDNSCSNDATEITSGSSVWDSNHGSETQTMTKHRFKAWETRKDVNRLCYCIANSPWMMFSWPKILLWFGMEFHQDYQLPMSVRPFPSGEPSEFWRCRAHSKNMRFGNFFTIRTTKNSKKLLVNDDLNEPTQTSPLEAMFKKLPQHLMERFRVIQVAFWWEERGWQELKTNTMYIILLGIIKKRVKQKYVVISTTTCLYHT